MATDRSAFFEIAKELIFDFLVFFGLMKRSEAGKVTVDSEKMKEVMGKLAPHIFGIGLNDEAMFNADLAKLEDRRQIKISRFMETLSDHNRARFILAVTILPEEKDRLDILKMYSELLSVEEMIAIAKNTRMITGTAGPFSAEGLAKIVLAISAIYKKALLPFAVINTMASNEARRREATWFGRLAKTLVR